MVYPGLVMLVVGVILLVLAYNVAMPTPPWRVLCLVFGWALTIIGGVVLILAVLGIPLGLPRAAGLGYALLVASPFGMTTTNSTYRLDVLLRLGLARALLGLRQCHPIPIPTASPK